MTVSTIASIAAGIGRNFGTQNAKIATSVKSLVSGSASKIDPSSLSLANNLQTQITSLRAATQNVAQTSSLVRVAEGSAEEITKALSRLQDLAARASNGSLSKSERISLDAEFQGVRASINRIAGHSSFGEQKLLDGSLTSESLQLTAADEEGFAIADLRDEALFGSGEVDLLTADGAQAALEKVRTAQTVVSEQQDTLGALSQGLEFAFASLETAGLNQEASRAVLSDDDFTELSTESQQAQVQAQATTALLAQTSKLPGNILALLTE